MPLTHRTKGKCNARVEISSLFIRMVMLDHEIVGDSANEGPDVWHDQWDPEKVVKIFVEGLITKSSDEG